MNRSPEKLDRFIRKASGSANNSTLGTPTKSNERPNEQAKEAAVEAVQLDVSSGSKSRKELSSWMRNGLEMLAPFQKMILEESKNKTHAFEKRLNRLTQTYLRKVEEVMKENKENNQTTARVAVGATPPATTSHAASSSSTMTSSSRYSSTPSTSRLPAVPSTSKTPTTTTLLNFFTHSQKETIVPKMAASVTPGTSGIENAVPSITPRKLQLPTEQSTPAKMTQTNSGSELMLTPKNTGDTTPSKKEVDKNDYHDILLLQIITLDDNDDDIQLVGEIPKSEQRSDAPEKQEDPDHQHADVSELPVDAVDEKEGDEDDGDDAMEGDSMEGITKKRKRQRKGDDLFIDMNDKMLLDVEDIEEGRKLTRAARRSGGLNTSNLSTDPHVAGSSEEIAASPVKKKKKRVVTTSEDSEAEGMNDESMETATEESMDEADERLPNEVSHISLEDRRGEVAVAAVAEAVVDTRDRQPKPHHGRGDMVRWTCGGKSCTRAYGTHVQVYQHMLYDHPLRPDHSDIVGLCECGLFADFPDLIVHRLKGDKGTYGAPHSTLVYWTYDEMEAEEMSEEEKARKGAFSDMAQELRRCIWRSCAKHNFLFDTFEEMEEHNAKQHNIKLLYTCRVDHPDEKSIVTCLSAPLFLKHERKCKSFCFPAITKIFVDKKRALKEAKEREATTAAQTSTMPLNE
ncbi:hypothetical protein PRIPAC_87188 [Pristionchus pacificus]|uniref:C2H2-type domain-containing protein n=1 Tax=Pristionchus pacificus TaxID=54126 RepID=A0A2A6CWP6_PRIPA|nr:hypothetical protein PRIPAC_87188 [Pristionchus pacificus]|eukprot:PDM82506.1 hypothetical protein PRIPAC_36899 [Pristionchus pacificus]